MSSGFNLLSLKKEDQQKIEKLYKRHLVIGEDVFSVVLLLKLIEKYGENQVGWICSHELNENDIVLMGPSSLRGTKNIEAFNKYFPDLNKEAKEHVSLFYKDSKWKEFGGRAKSEKLLWSEEFFTSTSADVNMKNIFSSLNDENLLSSLETKRMDMKVKTIDKLVPDDLAEPANFQVTVASGEHILCEKLYWGMGPSEFLNLYEDKNALSNEFIEFCEGTQSPSALYIRLDYEKPISDQSETLFIPLSYTHDWGHFIGEFKELEITPEKKFQRAEFVTFMDISHTSEEEISKKIRLLKKSFEKIFGDSATDFTSEFIKLDHYSGCLNIDDQLYSQVKNDWTFLNFFGLNAPLMNFEATSESCEDSRERVSFLSRALCRHQEIINFLD